MPGWKNWAALETVTEPDFQGFLQDQVVMRFADAAARTAALGANVTKGMVSYLTNTGTLEEYNGAAWEVAGGVRYGIVAGLNGTIAGMNNADITPVLTIPSAPYARVVAVGLRGTFTITGTGTPPRLRLMTDGTPQLPMVPVNVEVPTAGLTTLLTLGSGVSMALKGNIDVPTGYSVTFYNYETQLTAAVHRAGAGL